MSSLAFVLKRTYTLTFSSRLESPACRVWAAVGTMEGVNQELAPWLRMTSPAEASRARIEEAPLGEVMFASWVLLGGVLPIDRHSLRLVAVEPGRGFVEDSTSWTQMRWEHRRELTPTESAACVLTDRLTFTPRVRLVGPLLEAVVSAAFRHRHARLRARFGGEASGPNPR